MAECAELTASQRHPGIPLVATAPVKEIGPWALGCSDQLFSSVDSLKFFLAARSWGERLAQLWEQ